jgi:hypothetical protein
MPSVSESAVTVLLTPGVPVIEPSNPLSAAATPSPLIGLPLFGLYVLSTAIDTPPLASLTHQCVPS